MFCLLGLAFRSLVRPFRDRRDLIVENIVLRQQLVVLKRRHPRPALHLFDKLFWVTVSQLWSQWKQSLIVVTPETVIRWHVQGLLRNSKIQTTLDLYTQEDGDEARAAQGEYLMALGVATNTVL